jgi:hypothetical protein
MNWFKRTSSPTVAGRQPHAYPLPHDGLLAPAFTCATCGRADLPEAGDWDPPICQECDAAINDDAIQQETAHDGDADDDW